MLKVNQIKNKLSYFYQNNKFDLIGKLPNFKVIEKRDDKNDKEKKQECIWYITTKKPTSITGLFSFSDWQPENYCHVAHPNKEDIIVYHASQNGGGENHAGIYKGAGTVESKFGYGYVYLHPIDYVPNCYGPYVSFYTPQKDETIGSYATIDNMEKWIELYGAICSLQIHFSNQISESKEKKLLKFVDSNPNFLLKSNSFSMNLETRISNSHYIYRVKPGFLLDARNRQILKELYDEKCESLKGIKKNEPITSASKRVNSQTSFLTSFSYSLNEVVKMLQDENKLDHEENTEMPRSFKRLRRHPMCQEHATQTRNEENTEEEENLFSDLKNT